MKDNKIKLPKGNNKLPQKLIFFASQEVQKKYEVDYTNNQDAVERLRQTVKLIKTIYSEQLKSNKPNKKINFIRTS